jgi:hypothetical protein
VQVLRLGREERARADELEPGDSLGGGEPGVGHQEQRGERPRGLRGGANDRDAGLAIADGHELLDGAVGG